MKSLEVIKPKRVRKSIKSYKDRGLSKPLNKQQAKFIELYTSPKSPTFSNAYRSGIKAGFSEEYSKTIIYQNMAWLSEINIMLGDERRLRKAEKNLEEIQNIGIKTKRYRNIYEDNEVVDVEEYEELTDSSILALRVKTDMFLAERLDKVKYSTRSENAHIVKVEHSIDAETQKKLDALLNL